VEKIDVNRGGREELALVAGLNETLAARIIETLSGFLASATRWLTCMPVRAANTAELSRNHSKVIGSNISSTLQALHSHHYLTNSEEKMKKTLAAYVIVSAAALAPATVLACSAAGPSTHVGNVLSVDADQGRFTIRDAETMEPLTFTASESILGTLKNSAGMVFVDYEQDGDALKALNVTIQ